MDKEKDQIKHSMGSKIECPNCGKAYLEEKKIHGGAGASNTGELPDIETISIYECPKCHVQFDEEQLESKAEIKELIEKIGRELEGKNK